MKADTFSMKKKIDVSKVAVGLLDENDVGILEEFAENSLLSPEYLLIVVQEGPRVPKDDAQLSIFGLSQPRVVKDAAQ